MPPFPFTVSREINRAFNLALPIVALETTVITHGLPRPQNLSLARDMENAIREQGAIPATIGVLGGKVRVGMNGGELEELANDEAPLKVSMRDFATASVKAANGGTTVAGTMFVAQAAGIKVFATGGIGGVHKEARFDVSADMQALASIPMIVVCAGAKSILDLPATLEQLESLSVPVVGLESDEFPAFYARESGLKVSARLESVNEIVSFAQAHWGMGMKSAVLVTNPIPAGDQIPKKEMDGLIVRASLEAMEKKITGQDLTPYLLKRISELTNGRSLRANLALLLNNGRLAAQIAIAFAISQRRRVA